jgi:hypothetical protein
MQNREDVNQPRQAPQKIVIIHNLKGKYYLHELRKNQLQVQKSYESPPTEDQQYQAGFCPDWKWDARGNVMTPWGQENLHFVTNQTIQFFLVDDEYDGEVQQDKFNPKVYNELVIKELTAHLKTVQPRSKCIFKEVQRILESELPPFLAGDREWIPFLNTFQPLGPKSQLLPPQAGKESVHTIKMVPSALAETWEKFRDRHIGEVYNTIYSYMEREEPDETTQNQDYEAFKTLQRQALSIIESKSLPLNSKQKNEIFRLGDAYATNSGMSIVSSSKITKKVYYIILFYFTLFIFILFFILC